MIISQILTVAAISAPWRSLSSLWSSLRALQWAAAISALILTIGAVIEYWEKLKQLTLLIGRWLSGRSKPFDRCVLRKLIVHSIGPILVTLGIAGDFVFEGRTFVLENRQESESQDRISANEKKTAEANERVSKAQNEAAGFQAQIANANERSARANEVAESERLATEELQKQVEPRRLTPNQIRELESLTQFAGHTVDIGSYLDDPEGLVLSSQILNALTNAHIAIVDNRSTMETGSNVFLGVFVQHGDQALQDKLKAILSESGLTKTDVISRHIPSAPNGFLMFAGSVDAPPNSVHIMVGLKPIK